MSQISTPYYKTLDFLLVLLACVLAYWVRFDLFFMPIYYLLPTIIFALAAQLSLSVSGFYQSVNSGGENYSRVWLVTSIIFALVGLISSRTLLKNLFNVSLAKRTAVLVGKGRTANFVIERLSLESRDSVEIAKHFELEPTELNSFKEITEYIEDHRRNNDLKHPITDVWLTHSAFYKFDPVKLSSIFKDSAVKLVYIAELPEMFLQSDEEILRLDGIPTINAESSASHKLGNVLKFIEDQIIAWAALLILWPILVIVSVAIRIESSGPVIFRQKRYGLGGKDFLIWKFRTMYEAESCSEFEQAKKNDQRITKVGRVLRRTSLDELPQLFNVINGSMSIVGPRPHPVKLNEQHRPTIDQYMHRHISKPGITGLAQIKGFRGETSEPELMEQRVKYDLEYVRNWSIFLDIKILLLTFVHLLTTDKAH